MAYTSYVINGFCLTPDDGRCSSNQQFDVQRLNNVIFVVVGFVVLEILLYVPVFIWENGQFFFLSIFISKLICNKCILNMRPIVSHVKRRQSEWSKWTRQLKEKYLNIYPSYYFCNGHTFSFPFFSFFFRDSQWSIPSDYDLDMFTHFKTF